MEHAVSCSLLLFQSIKVQLKQTGGYVVLSFDEFQFHKGTIKTKLACEL